jgi:hypothetical protein
MLDAKIQSLDDDSCQLEGPNLVAVSFWGSFFFLFTYIPESKGQKKAASIPEG